MTHPVSVGGIRLYDEVVPTLAAGRYRFRSDLEIRDTTRAVPLPAPSEGVGAIEVAAPRFTIDRSEIASCYPPQSASGEFGDRLPHAALSRRSLPWERRLADGTPWIALVLVRADEADVVSSPLRAGLGAAAVAAMDAADPVVGDPTVTLLKVKDIAVFRAVLPSRAEVRLLAHARQVNVADTALAAGDDDGWFAVVTGNRLPVPGPTPVPYVACLVSLDGRDDVWTAAGPQPPPLLVLYSWTFSSGGLGGTFEHLAAHLELAPFGAPAAGAAALVDPQGAVRLDRTARDGSATTATYRGPLLGLAPDAVPAGAVDVTLAVARQLGLLLAGADGRFLRELVAWQRSAESVARTAIATAELADALAALRAAVPRRLRAALRAADDRAAPRGAAPAGSTLAAEVLDVLRLVHDRPADLWQPHPSGATLADRARRAAATPDGRDAEGDR